MWQDFLAWMYHRVENVYKDRETLNIHCDYVHADAEPQPKKKRSGW